MNDEKETDLTAAWASLVDGLRVAGERLEADTEGLSLAERADGYRALLRALNNHLGRFEVDRERPELVAFNEWREKMLMDNPDFRYWVADIADDRAYRITGTRGGARYVSITVYRAGGTLDAGAVARIDSDSISFGDDGRFEVILSPRRTDDDVDWLQLAPGASALWVRQFHGDVARDDLGECRIEPIDEPAPAPYIEPERFAHQVQRLGSAMATMPKLLAGSTKHDLQAPNEVRRWTEMTGGAAFTEPNIHYLRGAWQLADDQALVIEGRVPDCRYWNILLYSRYCNSLDHRRRGVSLTGATARLVGDRYRFAIAARDPGGAIDWLDNEGRPFGMFVLRFLQPAAEPDLPTVRVCRIADLSTGGDLVSIWRQPSRSAEARAAYAAAEADRHARPERYLLDADHVAAVAAGGQAAPRFVDGWRDGLVHYLGSAHEDGRLNALGTAMVLSTAVSRLRAGATMATHLDQHPEVSDRPLLPPIVIIGGWRTGTTFLFRLLATDPRLRGPLPSELGDPIRVSQLSGDDRERLIDASSKAHDLLHFLNPQLRAIHDSGPRLPEECVLAMGSDFRNWGFTSTVRLDGYAAWLAGEDLRGSYARYRRVLQVLDQGDDRRWVLKAPAHTAELPHVASAFPGAIVVQLHRDIVETIASGSSLFAVFRSMYSDEVDGPDVGRYQTEATELWLRRAKAFRDGPASRTVTFVDIDFPQLVRDPVGSIGRIYAAAGMEPPPDTARFVERYHAAFPRHAHGQHAYSAADFGLDEPAIRERFVGLEEVGT